MEGVIPVSSDYIQPHRRIRILGVAVDQVDMAEAVECMAGYIRHQHENTGTDVAKGLRHVVTANSEIVMMTRDDPDMARILSEASLVVADGIGLVWASRIIRQPFRERVAGIDLMDRMLALCAQEGWRPFLLGAAPGVAEEALETLQQRYPSLQVAGVHHGFFTPEEAPSVVARVNEAAPDLLLVAMGAPRQEKWIDAHRTELQVPMAVGVGGSFDIWAGRAERAPRWMCNAGLEWAYRLLRQPSRALRMTALPRFAIAVLWAKWHGEAQNSP